MSKILNDVIDLMKKTYGKKFEVIDVKPYDMKKFKCQYYKEPFSKPRIQKELRKLGKKLTVFVNNGDVYGWVAYTDCDTALKVLRNLDKAGLKHLIVGYVNDGMVLFEFE